MEDNLNFSKEFKDLDYSLVKEFYYNMLSKENNYKYLVFLNDRIYNLILLLEKNFTQKRKNLAKYYTASAFLLKMAKEEFNDYTTSVLILGDFIANGEELQTLCNKIWKNLEKYGDDFKRTNIVHSYFIGLSSLNKYKKTDVLAPYVKINMSYLKEIYEQDFTLILSNINSILINNNMNKSSFLLTDTISEEEFTKINSDELVFTNYFGEEYYTYIEDFSLNNLNEMGCLQFKKNKIFNEYLLTSYILVENISLDLLEKLWVLIKQELKNNNVSSKIIDEIESWKNINDSINFKEFITTIINASYLYYIKGKLNINTSLENRKDEINRVACNYNVFDVYVVDNICSIIDMVKSQKFISFSKIQNILTNFSKDIHNKEKVSLENLSDENSTEVMDKIILDEKFNFDRKVKEIRDLRENGVIIRNISEIKIKNSANIGKVIKMFDVKARYQIISYLLQLINMGLITLSVDADDELPKEYSLYFKTNEMTMAIYISKINEYMLFLNKLEGECDIVTNLRVLSSKEEKMLDVLNKYSEWQSCALDKNVIKEIITTLLNLDYLPSRWLSVNYKYIKNNNEFWKIYLKSNENLKNFEQFLTELDEQKKLKRIKQEI